MITAKITQASASHALRFLGLLDISSTVLISDKGTTPYPIA